MSNEERIRNVWIERGGRGGKEKAMEKKPKTKNETERKRGHNYKRGKRDRGRSQKLMRRN